MKKIITGIVLAAMLAANINFVYADVPSLSYTSSDMEGMLTLIEQCESEGHNTDYEMLNYSVLNRFITYTAEDIERGVSEDRLTHNINYLNSLYAETVDSLNGYLNGTEFSKPKGYDYVTGDYNVSENDILTNDGKPFFSSGYGHGSEAAYDMAIFSDMGMNNIQIEIDSSYVIGDNDGIPYWKYGVGSTGGTIEVDDTVGYNSTKSLKIVNPHEVEDNVYLTLIQDVPVKPNTDYTLTFWAKGDNVDSNAVVVYNGWNSPEKYSVTSEWKQYTYNFTTGSEYQTTIRLNVAGTAESLWFDDFALSGTVIENNGFEQAASDKKYEIYPYNEAIRVIRAHLANAEKNNIAVSLLLSPHYLKSYIQDTYPEVVSSKFGLMNFNVNAPEIRELLRDYVTEMIKAVDEFESVEGICITNEPTFNTSADVDFYEPLYREFLEEKYGTIENLNSAWGTNKSSFTSVDMPEAWAATPAYYDWMEFNETVFNDWHTWYAELVRENTTGTKLEGVPVYSKMMASRIVGNTKAFMDSGYDHYDFGQWQDIIGFDGGSDIYGGRIEKLQATDMLASVSDKPLYNNENHVIPDGDENYTSEHASHIYNDLWQNAIHGLDGSTLWVWSRTTSTADAKYGSIANRPDAIVAAGKATLDLNRNFDIVNAFQEKEKTVALYYSKSSNLYNMDNYKSALTAAYKELLMSGIRCGFVSEDRISDIDNYDTVVFPDVTNTTEKALEKLEEWVTNDGRAIFIGDGCLSKNEYNKEVSSSISGVTLTNNELAAQFADDVRFYAVNSDGTKVEDISVEDILYNDEVYINICNYSDTEEKSVYLTDNGTVTENVYDMISCSETEEIITLAPLQTMLVKVIEEKVIPVTKLAPEINLITQLPKNDATRMNISWTNPNYEISAIEVSEPTLGTVSTDAAIDLTAGAYNNFWISGLTDGTIYTFTVKITKADGNIEQFTTTGKAAAADVERYAELYGAKWNLKNEDRIDGTAVFIDSAEKAGGNSSLKIVKNNPSGNIELLSEASNKITLEEGAEYRLSFWTKTNLKGGTQNVVFWMWNTTGTFYASRSYDWVKNIYKISNITKGDDGKYSAIITGVDGKEVAIGGLSKLDFQARFVINGAGNAWIDDIELCKIAEDGTLGNNLYSTDNNFEWGGITGISATAGNTTATINWTNARGFKDNAVTTEAVVVDENGNVVATGDTTKGAANSLTIENLTNGQLYNYYIKAVVNGITQYIPVPVVPYYSPKDGNLITTDGYTVPWTLESNSGWSDNVRTEFYIDTDEKYSGVSSLYIKSKYDYSNWGNLKKDITGLDTSKKYKLSVYTKTNSTYTGYFRIEAAGDVFAKKQITTGGTSDWVLYETEAFTPTGSSLTLYLRMQGACKGDFWFDDMKIVEVDDEGNAVTGKNLITDGGFEFAQVTHPMYVPTKTSATLKWTNPNNQNISKVYLTSAENVIVTEELSTTKNERVSYTVSGLTEGNTYEYKVNIVLTNGEKIVKTFTVIPSDNRPFGKFMSVGYFGGVAEEAQLMLDETDKYSGSAAMKIITDYTTSNDGTQYGNVELSLGKIFSPEKTYKISFMYKNNVISGNSVSVRDSANSTRAFSIGCTKNTDGWTKGEATFTGVEQVIVQIMIDKLCGTMWFDDFVIREYDAENDVCVGDNLIKDGGFETDNIDKVKSITFAEADGKITANIIKYNSYESDCYMASYDADGKLIEVSLVKADTQGELMQTVSPAVNAGENVATVKAFVWDDMIPVGTATR